MPVLEPDSTMQFPSVTVLKASAGSGKTYALTERYVQFLLSTSIPRNDLRNILAITFSHNASRGMRESVLEWLKRLHFRDPGRLADICAVTAGGEDRVARRASTLVGEILSRYSDFQVRTIDSFMSTVFRASAIDLGFSPEFEILMDPAPLIDYAFTLFLREAREGSERAALLDGTVRAVLGFAGGEGRFPWDPVSLLLAEVKRIEWRLSMLDGSPAAPDEGPRMQELEAGILACLERVDALVRSSGLEENGRSTFSDLLARARAGRFGGLIGRGMKTPPVKKPGRKETAAHGSYEAIEAAWAEVGARVGAYAGCWARAFYAPVVRLHESLSATLERVKRSQGKVFIGDINRTLGTYLAAEVVPDIYFRLGERVSHFLVDEFQDTSPVQWRNLFPLIENSLAAGGSLFVVGDTKQAIYGFRQADYTIMRSLESENPFPSSRHAVRELSVNRRSRPRVLALASEVFKANARAAPRYAEAARRSGLDEWTQQALAGDDPGYAEVEILARDDEDPPERRRIQQIMEDLRLRGYRWGDIAILAPRNDDVVRATSWLNEKAIPFVSFSSLDVRRRRAAGEMRALLGFLDSPPDDLSFATFLLGDIFSRTLTGRHGWADAAPLHRFLFRSRGERPLYKAFQREFPELWKACFAGLFRSTGYLPLYDLVSEAYTAFRVFDVASDEEATLAKLLETVKEFEGAGSNSLRAFLEAAGAESDAGEWAIAVPRAADSVRAMTIHKSKGLGFPVVILLLYGETAHGFAYTVTRDSNGIGLIKVTRDLAAADPELQALYEEESTRDRVNRLNALYVALTRAKRELYVIGVKRKNDAYPFDLLPASSFPPSEEKGKAAGEQGSGETSAPLSHEALPVPASFGGRRLSREERRRGERVHRILSRVEYAGDDLEEVLTRAASHAAAEAREPGPDADAVAAISRMIRGEVLGGYFREHAGRQVLVEQEFCDGDGGLFRMDRVVVDQDRVTVIDFKTGAEDPEENERQLRGYMRILSGLHPGTPVEAVISYIDLGTVRRIS